VTNPARQDEADPCRSEARKPTLTLVKRPATAEPESIAELWRRNGEALQRFALTLTRGDRYRAEDIIQETLLRAWHHPEVVGGGDRAIRAWLFTVTRHVAIDMWRVRCRTEESIDDGQIDWADPAERIEQAVTALEVRAAIAQLTPEHRDVVVAMYFYGRSIAEIAQSLQIPVGTVKSRAHYGLRRLRELMSPETARLADPVVPGDHRAGDDVGQRRISA
jgi:RNA polymerase sigma-70 factor, ECF subfamily